MLVGELKTLVTLGKSGQHYVFVIPVAKELHLKKAAAAVGEKSIAMIHVSEITPLTGYVRGGCSPVGMKKLFRTVFDLSAENLDTIVGQLTCRVHHLFLGLCRARPCNHQGPFLLYARKGKRG